MRAKKATSDMLAPSIIARPASTSRLSLLYERGVKSHAGRDHLGGFMPSQALTDFTERLREIPAILGDIFAALARGQIDVPTLQRLVSTVERVPTHEIDTVRKLVESRSDAPARQAIDRESIQALIAAGLVDISAGSPIGGRLAYNSTQTAETFVRLELDIRSLKR